MKGCLIIHGFTGGPYEVDPLAKYLKERTDWKIEVPVLPGHGKELALENISYTSWLKKAENTLNELFTQCEHVYVIGFSMGGMIAAYLAAKYAIDRLVLLAPARRFISLKHLSRYVTQLIGDGFTGKLEENKFYKHYKSKASMVPLRSNIEFMKLVNKTKQYLDQVETPVLIAQGKKDMLVPLSAVYDLEKEISSEHKEVILFEQ